MNLHEYQARALLKAAGVPVPDGDVASTSDDVERIARDIGRGVVVKAQVHTGGRGKAGGVKLAADPAEARAVAEQILGMTIKGLTVEKVLVAPAAEIASESYVGIIVDRESQLPVLMVSPEGGVDIEEVAAKTPERISKFAIDPRFGLLAHQATAAAFFLYRDIKQVRQASVVLQQLYAAFIEAGASLAEINPLITDHEGTVVALDAKIAVDDNELDGKPAMAELRDVAAEAPSEVIAREAGLSFIQLDGTVGCCVNGAGLAMATMDLVKFYGGDPANFLDIGGSSNPEKVVSALEIISADSRIKSILFNIFGGITRCDDVANGIVTATKQLAFDLPMVIRLTGTNEDLAVEILNKAGFSALTDMDEAVQKAVGIAQEAA